MRRLLPLAVIAAALLLLASAAHAQSAEEIRIAGRVVHGVEGADFDPAQARVTLNVLEGVASFAQRSATPGPNGAFELEAPFSPAHTYFFTVEYQGAAYSVTRGAASLSDPLVITVYDSTHDASAIGIDSYTVIVAGADPEEGFVEILERAIVRNNSNRTLIPDSNAEGPAMMSFLRFALPPNAYNLDVRSNLVGGQVLEVDRGFALTTPILPTIGEPHQFEFVYRLDYGAPNIDVSRTMRFGADSFRFVAPANVASLASPRLDDLGAANLDGRLLRLLEGQNIEPAEFIELAVSGLPTQSGLDRALADAGVWYVRYAVPGAVALAASALLLIAATRRRPVSSSVAAAREEQLRQARLLADAYDSRAINHETRQRRGRAIRDALISLEVERRLSDASDTGRQDS